MISKFSFLYVGFTELDNVGLGGTPPDERRLSNDQIVKAYRMSLDMARHMDALGFDTLWARSITFSARGTRSSHISGVSAIWVSASTTPAIGGILAALRAYRVVGCRAQYVPARRGSSGRAG